MFVYHPLTNVDNKNNTVKTKDPTKNLLKIKLNRETFLVRTKIIEPLFFSCDIVPVITIKYTMIHIEFIFLKYCIQESFSVGSGKMISTSVATEANISLIYFASNGEENAKNKNNTNRISPFGVFKYSFISFLINSNLIIIIHHLNKDIF